MRQQLKNEDAHSFKMFLETVFVILLIVAFCVLAYRGANHEFQILQKDYTRDTDWTEVLNEQLPLVIRQLPNYWMGPWSQRTTEQKTWPVTITDAQGQQYRTTWNAWLATPNAPQPDNLQELGTHAKLQTILMNWNAEDFRCWSWLPTSAATIIPTVYSEQTPASLQKTTAESTVIVSTDGAPIELWIAHEGALSSDVSSRLLGNDPWTTTTDTIPLINEAKYIEIKLRPGNAVVLPKHWYYALHTSPDSQGNAWFWTASFHTPISFLMSLLKK